MGFAQQYLERYLREELEGNWGKELRKVKQLPQRQDSLTEQLEDLYIIANKFGMYDAADFIRYNILKGE